MMRSLTSKTCTALVTLIILAGCNIQDDMAGQAFEVGDLCSNEGDRSGQLECRGGRWTSIDALDMSQQPDQPGDAPDLPAVVPDQPEDTPDLGDEEDLGEQGEMGEPDLACRPLSDEALCESLGRVCGMATTVDSCGTTRELDCGVCAQGVCQQDGTCSVCEPETDAAFCARANIQCGELIGVDNCGVARTVASCGACPGAGDMCQGGQCVCAPETDAAFCARLGKDCGSVTDADNCGAQRTVASCGICNRTESCTANVCQCIPESDDQLCMNGGLVCGSHSGSDRCGNRRLVNCGTCRVNYTCQQDGTVCCPQGQICFRM